MNIKIYNSNFPFQATNSKYLTSQMINLETRFQTTNQSTGMFLLTRTQDR